MTYHVYIMASVLRGTLYIGITSNLGRRIVEHRSGHGSRFVWEYKVFRLVYAEAFDDPRVAIATENGSRNGIALGRLPWSRREIPSGMIYLPIFTWPEFLGPGSPLRSGRDDLAL